MPQCRVWRYGCRAQPAPHCPACAATSRRHAYEQIVWDMRILAGGGHSPSHPAYRTPIADGCQGPSSCVSPQNDNVLFAQSRNVLLTAPSLGDARRTTTDDTSRTGPPGGPEEGEEEADHAEGGGGRAGNHGKARAVSAAGTEAAWRPSGGARSAGTSLQPQDQCGYRTGGGGDPVTAGVPEIWADAG